MKKRIFGETDGIRAEVGKSPLRPNIITELGRIIAEKQNADGAGKFALGRDTRESGLWILDCMRQGLGLEHCVDYGVLPTPALAVLIADGDYVGGVMATASHNPFTDNGLKVFGADGDKISDDEELAIEADFFEHELEADIEPAAFDYNIECSEVALGQYIEIANRALDEEFGNHLVKGEIMLDSACGAGYIFSRKVFERYGIKVNQIDEKPNGQNINEGFGATHPEAIAEAAKKSGCIGVALDGDADRIIVADETGRIWNGDRIAVLLAEQLGATGVVLTEYSNLETINYLESKGIAVSKVVNGDRYVAERCLEEGKKLGAELAGHILYMPWMKSSDGTFMALVIMKIMERAGKKLSELWADYTEMPSKQFGVKVREKKPLEEIPGYVEMVREIQDELAGTGRVFVRYSGTENKLRILVEARDERKVDACGEKLQKLIEKEIGA